jgi:hypothetical protein
VSENFEGHIHIGGVLWKGPLPEGTEDITQEFVDHLCVTTPDFDWEPPNWSAVKTVADLEQFVVRGHLTFADQEASYGHFEEIEQKCQELNLSYDVFSGGHFEYEPQVEQFRAATGVCVCTPTTGDGDLLTYLEPIHKVYDYLRQGQIHQALTVLAEVYAKSPRVEPLPLFEIRERAPLCPTE